MVHPSVGSNPNPTRSQPGGAAPAPILHRALTGLMVDLDDELLRYRHSRTGQGPRPRSQRPLTFRPKANRSSLNLITLQQPASPRRSGQGSRQTPGQTPGQTATPGAVSHGQSHPAGSGSMPPGQVPAAAEAGQPNLFLGNTLVPYAATPDAYLESTEALLNSAPSNSAYPDSNDYLDTFYPDTYYSDEEHYEPSLAQRLSTPLGMGVLLLLLVGSAGFGYLVTSPTAIDHLRNHAWVQRFQGDAESEMGDSAGGTDDPTTASEPIPLPTGLQGIGPDLSGQEFGPLDLDRVSRLPAESSRTGQVSPVVPAETDARGADADPEPGEAATQDRPRSTEALRPAGTLRTEPVVPLTPSRSAPTTVAPSAVSPGAARPAAPQPSAPRSAPPAPPQAPPPALQAPVAPPPASVQPPQPLGTVTTAPTPTPSVSPPAPLAPAARPNYYVVTEYTGNPSLESARSVVGDAYVRDFQGGSKIQMGAFSQESSARDLVQQLQQQGIPAQVLSTP
ncbi:MAG: SPOR domain-containing protein [Spirulina sp.]